MEWLTSVLVAGAIAISVIAACVLSGPWIGWARPPRRPWTGE
jgi:energy-converting hydrogenase Eha subunit A